MSLLKVNEVQNYNGSSLTLTASTVSTSAQLNTGGNISVTGSINVSDDSTTRSNLGLGSIATQASDNVTITGGNISNATLASSVAFPAGHVIQTVYVTKNDENSAATSSSTASRVVDSSGNAEWAATISNLKSSSDVLVIVTFVSYLQKTADQMGGSFHIFRDTDGAGSNLTAVYTTSSNLAQMYEFTDLAPTGETMFVSDLQNITFIDEAPTNSSHTYYLGYSSFSSTSVTILNRMPFTMILQEVAR